MLRALRIVTTLPHRPTVILLHHPKKRDPSLIGRNILNCDFDLWIESLSGSMVFVNLTDVRLGLERLMVNGEEYTIFRGRSRVPGGDQDIGPLFL